MTKEPLPTTHNVERGARSTCREKPETGPSLEASEHQRDCSRVQKIDWRANMEKTVRRIFRRILKRDLALDRKSGRRRMALSSRR